MFVSVFSVFVAGDGLTIVVLVSVFSAGGFVTVVSFCSQAASNATPASKQMYFLILVESNLRADSVVFTARAMAKPQSIPPDWG